MKKVIIPLLALIISIVGGAFYFHPDVDEKPSYVTSKNCKSCHEAYYEAWHDNTLHPKMFRPVISPDDIQADFSKADPEVVTFTRDDIEFVIGNKWEQVYARMIDGEYYPLTAKWYITTQKWVPYKVKDWKETPLSVKCNGCHTTGFNPDTYEFSEFGIGCEACHGPGSNHADKKWAVSSPVCSLCHQDEPGESEPDIVNSVNSAVCGQCHTRGTQKQDTEHIQTTFSFPLNVTPGETIGKDFEFLTLETDKKKKHWWGIGLSKNRHQEFADFSQSKHGRALTLMRERHTKDRGAIEDSCLSCHSADYILAKDGQYPTLETAEQSLTCAVCHEPHGLDRTIKSANISTAKRCGGCHADSLTIKAAARGQKHYPGPPSSKSCPDCHMPYIVKSGGAFPIRSHAFKIVPPEATRDFGVPNSCQNGGCHEDKPLDWAITEFDKFYGSGRVDDPVVIKECGACHTVFDAPSRSRDAWVRIMNTLDNHYGKDATLDETVRRHILDYLTATTQ